jgi:DNA-directed RNA polymerase subunit RPC12/RpoP
MTEHPAGPPPLPGGSTVPPATGEQPAYKCAGCGARVEYAPGTTSLRCPYCRLEQPMIPAARTEIREHPIAELAVKPRAAVGHHVFTCRSCGATSESDDLATRCPFCASPLVADSEAVAQIAPEAVLPFGVDRAGVRGALRKWVASRAFAPNGFRTVAEAESLAGTYMPHWTYDASTRSDYTGERGDAYYRTETYTTTVDGESRTETRQVREIRWHHVSGSVDRAFDDVMVRGTDRVAHQKQDKLEPWPLDRAVAYRPEFLAGYTALRYDVEPTDGLESAKAVMADVIRQDCRHDIGGDEQRVHQVSTQYADLTYKLMLLPVWLVCYVYAGKTWQVVVNGCTGEVIGDRPYSRWKIAAVLAALAAVAAVVWIVLAYRHNG